MAQTPSKIHFPTGGDNWDPAGDMEALARSVVPIVPVANAAERNAVLSEYNPTASKPLFVNRADTGAIERHAGSGWTQIYPPTAVAGRRTDTTSRNAPTDTATLHSFVGGTQEYTGGVLGISGGVRVPLSGWYNLSAGVRWGAVGNGGYRQTIIRVNGTTVTMWNDPADPNMIQNPSIDSVPLQANDEVTLHLWQNSGATVSTSPNFGMPFLSVALIGR